MNIDTVGSDPIPWKTYKFHYWRENRAQNCLTVSAITTRILEEPSKKITDVSGFRARGMKATEEQVSCCGDGEMCAQ